MKINQLFDIYIRNTITITTTADIFGYELNTANSTSTILSVINGTTGTNLQYATAAQFNEWYINDSPTTGTVTHYSYNGVSSDGDTIIEFYPQPSGVETLRVNMISRGTDLVAVSDTIVVPSRPVILLAYAKAVEERGEDGGVGSGPAYSMAVRSLSDMISLDSMRHPEELIWDSGMTYGKYN